MKHKHYDCIVAWANGEEVQVKDQDDNWWSNSLPSWFENLEYRVKPKDMGVFCSAYFDCGVLHVEVSKEFAPNFKLILDGGTKKLKDVSFIPHDDN